MRKVYSAIYLLILAIAGLYMNACSAGSCFDQTEARVKGTFYSSATHIAHPPDSVTLYGINMDTLTFYDKTLNLRTAEFPLFAEDQDQKMVIRINGINDTVEFRYSSYPHLLSKECGYTFFFTLDTVIHTINIIDSISIKKNTITTFNEENIRIFY